MIHLLGDSAGFTNAGHSWTQMWRLGLALTYFIFHYRLLCTAVDIAMDRDERKMSTKNQKTIVFRNVGPLYL